MWCGGGRRIDEAKRTETFGLVLYPTISDHDTSMYLFHLVFDQDAKTARVGLLVKSSSTSLV